MWQVTAVIGKDRVKICSDNPSPIILSSALASQSFEEREIVLGAGEGAFLDTLFTNWSLTGFEFSEDRDLCFFCVSIPNTSSMGPDPRKVCWAEGDTVQMKVNLSTPGNKSSSLGGSFTIKHKPLLRLSEQPRGISLLLSIRALCKIGRFSSSLGMPSNFLPLTS